LRQFHARAGWVHTIGSLQYKAFVLLLGDVSVFRQEIPKLCGLPAIQTRLTLANNFNHAEGDKPVRDRVATCIAVAFIGLGVFALVYSAERAKADEKNAEYVLRSSPDSSDYGFAIKKLRNAALNWRNALRFDEAKRLDERANIIEAEEAKRKEDAKYAMKPREQGTGLIPQSTEPTTLRPAIQLYPWKTNVVTTVFWVGEKGNHGSVWNLNWTSDYGGWIIPIHRHGTATSQSTSSRVKIPSTAPFHITM
jgi:hypothetical protein